jgi:pimeloyl-ACP methyl ester carboxylesterase
MLQRYTARRLTAVFTFFPFQRAPYSQPIRPIQIATDDGIQLDAVWLAHNRPDLVVICHGFAAGQYTPGIVWLAEMLTGYRDVLTFDWRGYGRSTGHATLGAAEALDLAAVLRWATTQGYRRVAVIGESMGGFLALAALGAAAAATQGQVTALPFPYPDRIATLGAPVDYALTGFPRPQMLRYLAPHAPLRPLARLMGFRIGTLAVPQPLASVGHIPVPLLLLHGDRDRVVFVENAYRWQAHAPTATLQIYPGVGHGVVDMRRQIPQQLLADLGSFLRTE